MPIDLFETEVPNNFELLPNEEGVQLKDEVVRLWNEIRNIEPGFDYSNDDEYRRIAILPYRIN